jgi:predicted transposase YdaD
MFYLIIREIQKIGISFHIPILDGKEKGIAKGKAEVARNMLAIGMSWPQIVQLTGLTEDQLKQLQS